MQIRRLCLCIRRWFSWRSIHSIRLPILFLGAFSYWWLRLGWSSQQMQAKCSLVWLAQDISFDEAGFGRFHTSFQLKRYITSECFLIQFFDNCLDFRSLAFNILLSSYSGMKIVLACSLFDHLNHRVVSACLYLAKAVRLWNNRPGDLISSKYQYHQSYKP